MDALTRRRLLKLGGAALALPALVRPGLAQRAGQARRLIVFYYPDGVVGPSQDGQPSRWHPTGGAHDFALTDQNDALTPFKDRCVFFKGLTSGPTDSGSHPGGAQKLLTAADYGQGESIDQYLARTAGAGMPWRHLYLGAMANQDNASGDKHVSYPSAGNSITPEDNPRRAFELLFGTGAPAGEGGEAEADPTRASVLDGVLADMDRLMASEFREALPTLMTRAILSTVAKTAAAYGVNEATRDDETINAAARIAAGLYAYSQNRADTRAWATLPKRYLYARVPAPRDGSVLLITPDGQSVFVDVETEASSILFVRSLRPGVGLRVRSVNFGAGVSVGGPAGGSADGAESVGPLSE